MTINEITNCVDLMSRVTKDRTELCKDGSSNSASSSSSSQQQQQQLPSIVISTSTGNQASHNDTVTVVDKVHKSLGACTVHNQIPSVASVVGEDHITTVKSISTAMMEHHTDNNTIRILSDGQQFNLHNNNNGSTQIPICVDGRNLEEERGCFDSSDENLDEGNRITRPTTLTSTNLTAAAAASLSAPKPPEFSISPAESLSKASSNELSTNEPNEMSSSAFLPHMYKTPHSPSSLSVNFCK